MIERDALEAAAEGIRPRLRSAEEALAQATMNLAALASARTKGAAQLEALRARAEAAELRASAAEDTAAPHRVIRYIRSGVT